VLKVTELAMALPLRVRASQMKRNSALFLLSPSLLAFACATNIEREVTSDQAQTIADLAHAEPALKTYLEDIAVGGALDSWAKRHRELKSHGCVSEGGVVKCFADKADFRLGTVNITGVAAATKPYRMVNVLSNGSQGAETPAVNNGSRPLPLLTSFWTRSSADGRYVGMSEWVLDLDRWVGRSKGAMIKVGAPYDPQFSADNKSLSWAGSSAGGIAVCNQSALELTSNDASASFDFDDDSCASISSGVYQSLGSPLDPGAPMFMTNSAFHTNDPGNGAIEAGYSSAAFTIFTPMKYNGTTYVVLPAINLALPFEGDVMLAPSGRLFVSRVSDGTRQTGYRVSKLTSSTRGDGSLALSAAAVGEVALRGGKASFSFDERFLVTHSYAQQADPSLTIEAGSSDIVLVDLASGKGYQLTHVPAGVRALYPHFRADGFIYFVVRDYRSADKREYIVGTDAARELAKP